MRLLRITLFVLLGILLLCGVAAAQDVSVRYQGQAISNRGLPLANQSVAICGQPAVTTTQPCSPLATLATSTSTSSGGANPTTTDVNGNYFFYAAPGKYTIQIYGPLVQTPFVQPDVDINTGPFGTNGNVALKNFSNDHIQYVSIVGNDSNDGLSWGTAKLTPNGAITVLGSTGGTVILGAGTFAAPTCANVKSGTQFIGLGSPTSVPFAQPMTQLTFTSTCLLNDVGSTLWQNIAFDFSTAAGASGLELRSTSVGALHNRFIGDMFLQCGGGGAGGVPCIKLNASAGTNVNVAENFFLDDQLYCNNTHGTNPGPAIGIQLIGSGAVNAGSFATENTFHDILIRGGLQGGVDLELNSDSNYGTNVQAFQEWNATPANSYVIAYNLNTPASDQDSDNSSFQTGITGSNFTAYVIEGQATGNILDVITASATPSIGVQVQGGTPQFCGRMQGLNGAYALGTYCYIGTQAIFNQQTIFLGGPGSGNYTGTNTTYATVDSTNLCKTITIPRAFKAIITVTGNAFTNTAAVQASFSIADVGATCAGAGTTPLTEAFMFGPGVGSGFLVPVTAEFSFNGDNATHSFALQAKTSNAADAWGLTNNATSNAPKIVIVFVPST